MLPGMPGQCPAMPARHARRRDLACRACRNHVPRMPMAHCTECKGSTAPDVAAMLCKCRSNACIRHFHAVGGWVTHSLHSCLISCAPSLEWSSRHIPFSPSTLRSLTRLRQARLMAASSARASATFLAFTSFRTCLRCCVYARSAASTAPSLMLPVPYYRHNFNSASAGIDDVCYVQNV
jgi:hypothetical protein